MLRLIAGSLLARWTFLCSIMLDDCSRVFVGFKLYARELLLSYLDFLPASFLSYGRPLQIYVDYHAVSFSHNPDAMTQLGAALKFYDISFVYAQPFKPKSPFHTALFRYNLRHRLSRQHSPPLFDLLDDFGIWAFIVILVFLVATGAFEQALFPPIIDQVGFAVDQFTNLAGSEDRGHEGARLG